MQQLTYDSCLLYINKKGFGVVELQIDDTLILKNETFADVENFHFRKIKLLAKNRNQLTFQHSIKLNDAYIKQKNSSKQKKFFYLNQERLCKNLRLITFQSNDLTSARGVLRKSVSFENQYVAQKTRDVYIATFNQSKTTFDLSFVVQVITSKQEDVKRLNKRIQ